MMLNYLIGILIVFLVIDTFLNLKLFNLEKSLKN